MDPGMIYAQEIFMQNMSVILKKSSPPWTVLTSVLAFIVLAIPPASGQLTTPLHIGTTTPIMNEFGQPLPGNYQNHGALVVVYQAPDQMIYPPDAHGNPHPLNPPLPGAESRIGRLTHRHSETPAMFGLAIAGPARPANGTPLFVRVFNRETIEDSTFYRDSDLFIVSGNKSFNLVLPATDVPIDDADNDGDGLNNSWERSYGTDPDVVDTSGNGMSDYEAVMAGIDPLDPTAFFGMTVTEIDASRIIFRWASRPGNLYQIEYTDRLDGDPVFIPASEPFIADDDFTEFDVAPWFFTGDQPRFFRLRLILTPEA
jgi:hypothetical protein